MALGACQSTPAPFGEAVLVIHTDVAIPVRASRLRIEVFNEDRTLLDSREVIAPNPTDWPISFSVAADREEERTVLVRLRAFPDGHSVTRAELASFATETGAADRLAFGSIADACAAAPTLTIGTPLTLRRGSTAVTTLLPYQPPQGDPQCTRETRAGSVAAKLVIDQPDRYRVEVSSVIPDKPHGERGGDTTLALRSDCLFPTAQIVCSDDISAANPLSAVELDMQPGTYWVVTGGAEAAPADVTLLASRVNTAIAAVPPPPPIKDPDLLEPAPGVTIDRLIRVHLVPGERGTLRVPLLGECVGTPADIDHETTCVDGANTRVAVDTFFTRGRIAHDLDAPLPPWPGDESVPCTMAPRHTGGLDDEVCVPGGAFLLGDRRALQDQRFQSQPERMRVIAPFLMDTYEMTVGRYRDAIRRGYVPKAGAVVINNSALFEGSGDSVCTFNQSVEHPPEPFDLVVARENFPLNCVNWEEARAVCQFLGADLPSEDQWEYAATAAGRRFETQYPWGDDLPTCADTAYDRSQTSLSKTCAPDFGPVPVDATPFRDRDRTPAGVVGLAGNVSEWQANGFYPYRDRAWQEASLHQSLPQWANTDAPLRATRGSDWGSGVTFATGSARRAASVLSRFGNIGFRCSRAGK